MAPKRKQPTRAVKNPSVFATTRAKVRKKTSKAKSAGSSRKVASGETAQGDQTQSYKTKLELKSVNYICDNNSKDKCRSVCYHSVTGDLLLGCQSGIKIFRRQTGTEQLTTDFPDAIVAECQGDVFISSVKVDTASIYKFNMDDMTGKELFSFYPMKSRPYSYLTASERYLACINDDENMELYNRKTSLFSRLSSKPLPGLQGVTNLRFLPDGSLLAAGWSQNKWLIGRFEIKENDEFLQLWLGDELYHPCGMAPATNGHIFVSSMGKTVSMLSQDGKVLREVTNKKERVWYYNMSVLDDELAVAGCNADKVIFYKINY